MKCWHITAWDDLYESAQSRNVQTLSFYGKSNKLIGEGLGFTLAQPDGLALLGTWALIEALASHGLPRQRGWLFRNGSALAAPRMAALLRMPVEPFTRALNHFSTPPMDWLEERERSAPSERTDSKPSVNYERTNSATSAPSERTDSISVRGLKERGLKERRKTEEGETPSHAAAGAGIPSLEEVLKWALQAKVDPDYAALKHAECSERDGWEVRGKLVDWQARWARYWAEDGAAWLNPQKNAARPGGRPDGWKDDDQEWWWTDAVETVKATLSGAALKGDEKTAARLREIIAARKQK